MKKNYTSFRCQEVPEYRYAKVLSDTTLTVLERTVLWAIILSLVKCRFQNHWSNSKHNAKVQTVN